MAEARTDRDRIEELEARLQGMEARYKVLVDGLSEGVCLLDAGRRLVLANPAAQAYLPVLTGAGEGEVVTHIGGYALEEILAPGEEGLPHEVAVEGPPRQFFDVQGRPIREDGGWALVIREVTQEREIQERVQLQDRLAAVGQLAAGVAHDFNNILGVIMGYAEMLGMRSDLPERVQQNVSTIFSQGERGEQLIRQILDFSRKTTAQRQPMDLVPLLKEVVRLLDRTFPASIRIVSAVDSGAYVLNANLTQIQQVITNLAVNARDAMPEGGELRIGLTHRRLEAGERLQIQSSSSRIVPELEPGEWMELTVSDTGTGIPPEVLTRIFQPFFTTKQPGKGTGLGLAQVYGIVKQNGGYIDVESDVGAGATFTIYLKRIAEEAAPVEAAAEGEFPKGQGETVLVVEDDEVVLQMVEDLLVSLNYRVLKAGNGRQALEAYEARAEEVALVLTDVVMPEMGGGELVAALRERQPDIAVVIMTGYPVGQGEGTPLPDRIRGFLEKPIDLLSVSQAVRKALTTDS